MGNYIWQKYGLLKGKGNTWDQLEKARKALVVEQ
jgi:hypothetical protein